MRISGNEPSSIQVYTKTVELQNLFCAFKCTIRPVKGGKTRMNSLHRISVHTRNERERPYLVPLSTLWILERKEKRQCFHNSSNVDTIICTIRGSLVK